MKLLSSTSAVFKAFACAVVLVSTIGSAYAQTDPPGRVARLNYISGSVTFAPAASELWAYAELNRPLTAGDSVWADRGARAELHIGSTAVRLDSMSSLNILDLTDDMAQLKLSQGSLNLRVRSLPNNQNFEIDTPNLAFAIQEPGEYRLSVAADGSSTTVIVRRGMGIVYGDNDNLTLQENEQMRFSGTNLAQMALGTAAPYDGFDLWARERDRAEDGSTSARYVSREVIGYEQLDSYGTWETTVEYGAVWIPRVVAVGWSPYRTGHWAWVAPWGWTWVDDAPWGFAPYHYGRWAYLHSGWCWVPGPRLHTAPVYAPALVAFVGGNSGVSIGLSASSGRTRHGPGVAWFPLAPGEHYHPGYRASPYYIDRVNGAGGTSRATSTNTTNITNISKNVYINQNVVNAVTAVPAAAFVKGQAIGPLARPLRPHEIGKFEVATAAPQIAPVKESILGDAKPAAIPAAVNMLQRPVVATVAPPTAAARHDALAQQFAQHPGVSIPGLGPALVRQQGDAATARPAQGLGNPPNPDAQNERGRQPFQGVGPSSVRVVTEHPSTERRSNVKEQRTTLAPDQANVIGNLPRATPAAPPAQPEPEHRPQGNPANLGATPARNIPPVRELPAKEFSGNVPRATSMPADSGRRQPASPAENEGGRGFAPTLNRPQIPATPSASPAISAAPALVPQPPSDARRDAGREINRPAIERRGRDMPEPRDISRNQAGANMDNAARVPHYPQTPAQARPEQVQTMPMPANRATPHPPEVVPQAVPQPQRRAERQEQVELRREAMPRPAPVAAPPTVAPAPMPMPMPAPVRQERQERDSKEKPERAIPKNNRAE
ncbi:MAG: DUF6600 domain-containing protein [Pseudomonadota bacterium]